MISENYRAILAQTHSAHENWGTSARKHVRNVQRLITPDVQSILDYGCGKGELKRSLSPLLNSGLMRVFHEYDPGIPGKDDRPRNQYDLVCCLDVMEHIEPDHLVDVMEHLQDLIGKLGFFVISNRYAKAMLSDGRNAHLIVEGPSWWENVFRAYFKNVTMGFDGALSETYIIVSADDYPVQLEVISRR